MVAPFAVLAIASLAVMLGKAVGFGALPLLARLMVVATLVLQGARVCDMDRAQWLYGERAWQMGSIEPQHRSWFEKCVSTGKRLGISMEIGSSSA